MKKIMRDWGSLKNQRGAMGLILVLIVLVIGSIIVLKNMEILTFNENKIGAAKEAPNQVLEDFRGKAREIEKKLQK